LNLAKVRNLRKVLLTFFLATTYFITYVIAKLFKVFMKTINATNARKYLYKLINETAEVHEPIQITGKKNNAVLIAEEDWRAVQETLFLTSIPGMRESIREGLTTPPEECSEELDW